MDNLENLDKKMIYLAKNACQKNAIITARMLSRTAPKRTGKLQNSFSAQLKNNSWYVMGAKHWIFSEKGTVGRKTKKGASRGKQRGSNYASNAIKKLQSTYELNISKITK